MKKESKTRNLSKKLCSCIKTVRNKVRIGRRKLTRKQKEKLAIGICVKSVLQTRGKTLRKFQCGEKPKLNLQPMKNKTE